jgi:hypothetical protein
MTKKITVATFKAFVRKNRDKLLIKCMSSFDAMTDGTEYNHGAAYEPVKATDCDAGHTLGISGVWIVGRSRDYVNAITEPGLVGYEVHNCCGNFAVAIKA